MRDDNKSFFGERLVLDGHEYRGCTFSKCQLVFRGEQAFVIVDCLFQNPRWVAEGPAANTIKFLTEAYHKLGEPGIRLVEETFNNIRLNKIYFAAEAIGRAKFRGNDSAAGVAIATLDGDVLNRSCSCAVDSISLT